MRTLSQIEDANDFDTLQSQAEFGPHFILDIEVPNEHDWISQGFVTFH